MNAYRILVKGIVKHNDKYLIVEKWYDDNIMEPYQWEFLDGEAEFGESPDKAVVRMIQEQTGLTAETDRVLYTWTFMVGEVCSLGLAYLCYTEMEEDDVQLSEELHDCRWVEAVELETVLSNPKMLDDLQKAELY